jgi:uncharacterized protein (TIGR02453 family)
VVAQRHLPDVACFAIDGIAAKRLVRPRRQAFANEDEAGIAGNESGTEIHAVQLDVGVAQVDVLVPRHENNDLAGLCIGKPVSRPSCCRGRRAHIAVAGGGRCAQGSKREREGDEREPAHPSSLTIRAALCNCPCSQPRYNGPVETKPCFSAEALRFLRGLKRNNDREWFEGRREVWEHDLKAPMLALIERITDGMMDYAPQHVRPAPKCLFRIYRDTRFSADKSPYKTHVAAWWSRHGLEKTSGGGYYLHLSSTELVIAAGVYMPQKEQLLAIRRHLLEHHAEWQRLIENRKLLRAFRLHDPMALARPPRGFPAEHPAMEWIKWRQWGVTAHLPAEDALKPTLAAEVEKRFRLAAPLVDFLNAPLASRPRRRVAAADLLPE